MNGTVFEQPLYRGQEVLINSQATKESSFYAIICDNYRHGLWEGILIMSANASKVKIIKWAMSRIHPVLPITDELD